MRHKKAEDNGVDAGFKSCLALHSKQVVRCIARDSMG